MTSARPLLLLVLVACGQRAIPTIASSPTESSSHLLTAKSPVPGHYVVVMTPSLARDDMASLALGAHATVSQVYSHALTGFAAQMSADNALQLSRDPRVAYVEESRTVSAQAGRSQSATAPWALDRIDQSAPPLDGQYDTGSDHGEGVTAYVFDTGIRSTHHDFGGRVLPGFNAIADGQSTEDCDGHGTHVASILGGTQWGVAKAVSLVPVRVLDCNEQGFNETVIAGIEWMLAQGRTPSVANLSFYGEHSQALDDAITAAITQGITFTVAAGNDGNSVCAGSPADTPGALTIGYTDEGDARDYYSNDGPCVDLFAPGADITAAWGDTDDDTYSQDGTSESAPMVAGAAALYLSVHPAATPADVRAALMYGAVAGTVTNLDLFTANSFLNVSFARAGASPPPAGTPQNISSAFVVTNAAPANFPALNVIAGTSITVSTTGQGDGDLYVRFNTAPTAIEYDCRSAKSGLNENCVVTVPGGSTQAFVQVQSYGKGSGTMSASWLAP